MIRALFLFNVGAFLLFLNACAFFQALDLRPGWCPIYVIGAACSCYGMWAWWKRLLP